MKKIFLLFFLILVYTFSQSQHVIYYQDFNGSIGYGRFTRTIVCDTTAGGNYLVAGSTASDIGQSYVYGVLDQNGNVLWEKDSAVYGSLGMHDAAFTRGKRTPDNGFIFCGSLANYGVSNEQGIFILKTDSNGNEVWRKNFMQFQKGQAEDVYIHPDSSYYFTGYISDTSTGDWDSFLLKLSPSGDSLFMHIYPVDGIPQNIFRIDDRFLICCYLYQLNGLTGYSFIATDSAGNLLSMHSVYDSLNHQLPRSFWKTNDDNFLILCTASDSTTNGVLKLIKSDTTASVLWEKVVHNQSIGGYACELNDGNILVAFRNNELQKLNSAGDTIWTKALGDTAHQLFIDTESYYVFPLNSNTFLVSSLRSVSAPGGSWPYLTKISDTTLTAIGEIDVVNFSISPNPTHQYFTVSMTNQVQDMNLEVYNLLGEKVLSSVFRKQSIMNCEHFPPGIYVVTIQTTNGIAVQKLIKQ